MGMPQESALLCMLKKNLPAGRAQAAALAALDQWALENPEPYLGSHWPQR
jgi:hypothetical protein